MRQGVIVTALLAVVGLPTAFFADGGWDGVSRDLGHVADFRPFAPAPSRGAATPRETRGNSITTGAIAARDNAIEGTASTAMTLARGAVKTAYGSRPGSSPWLAKPNDPNFERPQAKGETPDLAGDLRSAASRAQAGQVKVASLGDPKDYGTALKRYALAADPGNPDLRYAIALDYLNAAPPDYGRAVRWLTSAADLGSGRAALDLSSLYLEGTGVERNYPEAYLWANVAKRSLSVPMDQTMAVSRAARLAKAMTLAERELAEMLVAAWKPLSLSGPDDPAALALPDPFEDG